MDKITPDLENWIALKNTYDPAHYPPGKLITAAEWNTLFAAEVALGNYLSETIALLLNDYKLNLTDINQDIIDLNTYYNSVNTLAQSAKNLAEIANTLAEVTAEKAETIANLLANDYYTKTETEALVNNPEVNVGTTTTVSSDLPANVTNSGTSKKVILDFEIPQGVKGDAGRDGNGVFAMAVEDGDLIMYEQALENADFEIGTDGYMRVKVGG